MRNFLLLAAAAALAGGCASNRTPVAPVDANSPLAAPMFLQMATSSNLWEIQSSQLAHQRAQSPSVHQFASMIVADHTMLGQQMMAAAQSAGLAPPPQVMMPQEQQMLAQLQASPAGAAFEMAYRDMQIAAHQKAIALFQNYASSGDNATLRATAAQALPKLQQHLAHAQSLQVGAMPLQQLPPAPVQPLPGERG